MEQYLETEAITDIPREDIGIYLTAIQGQVDYLMDYLMDYLISANRELLRQAMAKQKQFQCVTANQFLRQHIQ